MRLRQLYLWHRYLGIGLCLMFAMWFVSGVAMMYVRMPILFPAERFTYLDRVDPVSVLISADEAARRAGLVQPPQRIRLVSVLGRPVYLLLPRGERWRGIWADDGSPFEIVSAETSVRIVARAHPGSHPRYVRTIDAIDQWTLTNSLNLHRPLHRMAVGDAAGTEVYVSAVTGEIVMRTTSRERALAWLGPIVHWGAPEFLRNHVGLWRQWMLWASFAGILLIVTGSSIGILRYRSRGYRLRDRLSPSPYTGWKRWHHYGGLVFGAVTFTWMISGWLYLNPGGGRSSPLSTVTTMTPYNVGGIRADNGARPEHSDALSGGPLEPALFTASVSGSWATIPESAHPREVLLTRVGGEPYYVFYEDWDRSWIVPAGAGGRVARERFDLADLTSIAARMIPDARLTSARLVEEYDGYYYSVGAVAPKRLPVFLATFDDADATWYYIDPYNGSVFRRYDRYGRVMRWLVNGLHTLDVPLLFANRPAWDLTIILLSAGGLGLSLTGVVLGWRRVTARHRPGVRLPRRVGPADRGDAIDLGAAEKRS